MINVFTAPYLFDGEKIIEDGAIAFNGKFFSLVTKKMYFLIQMTQSINCVITQMAL